MGLAEFKVFEPHGVFFEGELDCIFGGGKLGDFDGQHVLANTGQALIHGVVERLDVMGSDVAESVLDDLVGEANSLVEGFIFYLVFAGHGNTTKLILTKNSCNLF